MVHSISSSAAEILENSTDFLINQTPMRHHRMKFSMRMQTARNRRPPAGCLHFVAGLNRTPSTQFQKGSGKMMAVLGNLTRLLRRQV